ncbi:MAG: hypothetical protein LVQ96_00540 [Thermoplasmatales archaeon]|nr:hypothetical protein [Thermoplasmatales archaeon]MCW6169646.1 hypothetical protein [Thermoplasmatales archaeon]
MKKLKLISVVVLAVVLLGTIGIAGNSSATVPTLPLPPSSLPTMTYYTTNGTGYAINTTLWAELFFDVIDNSSYVSFNWSANSTQYLIVFDLSYTGLNAYGLQFISSLSSIGAPTVPHYKQAFNMTKNMLSQAKNNGKTVTNIVALDYGSFPGFSWSTVNIKSNLTEYRDIGIVVAIVVAMFALYYYFNRKK